MILEGENAVIKYREIMGSTDPKKAEEGSIRKMYGISIDKNSVHGSDSLANGKKEITEFHTKIMKQFSRISEAFSELDLEKAQKVMRKDEKYRELESNFRRVHLERVQAEVNKSVATHEIHMELMDLLKQISVYIGNIAKTILDMKHQQ